MERAVEVPAAIRQLESHHILAGAHVAGDIRFVGEHQHMLLASVHGNLRHGEAAVQAQLRFGSLGDERHAHANGAREEREAVRASEFRFTYLRGSVTRNGPSVRRVFFAPGSISRRFDARSLRAGRCPQCPFRSSGSLPDSPSCRHDRSTRRCIPCIRAPADNSRS